MYYLPMDNYQLWSTNFGQWYNRAYCQHKLKNPAEDFLMPIIMACDEMHLARFGEPSLVLGPLPTPFALLLYLTSWSSDKQKGYASPPNGNVFRLVIHLWADSSIIIISLLLLLIGTLKKTYDDRRGLRRGQALNMSLLHRLRGGQALHLSILCLSGLPRILTTAISTCSRIQ
jgi:hypothetical protein